MLTSTSSDETSPDFHQHQHSLAKSDLTLYVFKDVDSFVFLFSSRHSINLIEKTFDELRQERKRRRKRVIKASLRLGHVQ